MKHLEEWTWNVAKSNAGIAVFYKRGDEEIALTVVPGAGGNEPLQFKGNPLQNHWKRFLVGTADLRNFYPPKKDDVIRFWSTGATWTVKPNASGATFTEVGAYGTMIQIHTVKG